MRIELWIKLWKQLWLELLSKAEVLQAEVLQGEDLQVEVQLVRPPGELLCTGSGFDLLRSGAHVLCSGPDLLRSRRDVRCPVMQRSGWWCDRCTSAAAGRSSGSGPGPQGLIEIPSDG